MLRFKVFEDEENDFPWWYALGPWNDLFTGDRSASKHGLYWMVLIEDPEGVVGTLVLNRCGNLSNLPANRNEMVAVLKLLGVDMHWDLTPDDALMGRIEEYMENGY